MKHISDEQAELMASYTSSDTAQLPTIDVIADQIYNDGNYDFWTYSGSHDYDGIPGNGPGCRTHSSPAPSSTPNGVNLEKLRDLVMNISQAMGGQTNFDKQEQGVFIVREANGDLRVGNIAVGTAFGVNAEISTSAGEKIVAMIHTHTPSPGSDTRLPSNAFNHADGGPGDVADAARMMASGAVDPGALYYVMDRTGTYEYTWSGPEIRLIGADIAHDSVPCG